MVWIFVVIAALLVFVIAAVTVGREAFRLGHQPPATIFDIDEAVAAVADALPEDAQGRLSYDEVRALIAAELDHLRAKGLFSLPGDETAVDDERELVLADDDAIAHVLGDAEDVGLEVTDTDVFHVIEALHAHLATIGAVGPQAERRPPERAGGAPTGNGDGPDHGAGPGDSGPAEAGRPD